MAMEMNDTDTEERISERIDEQTVDVLVPQIREQIIEVVKVFPVPQTVEDMQAVCLKSVFQNTPRKKSSTFLRN